MHYVSFNGTFCTALIILILLGIIFLLMEKEQATGKTILKYMYIFLADFMALNKLELQ